MAPASFVSPQPDSSGDSLASLEWLADRVPDRVLILRRDLTIRYANKSSRDVFRGDGRPLTCFDAFGVPAEMCHRCPAASVFQSGHSCRLSEKDTFPACGVTEAIAVGSSVEAPAFVMVVTGTPTLIHVLPEAGSPVDGPGRLIGASAPMRQLGETLRVIAPSQAPVLIYGESGTGKELVARTLHELSGRAGPFVVVDCGSLPDTLLESELFGHVKGAFTGAIANKQGLFAAANAGTILLDEIADTSPQFQAKLLRVLQEGEVRPVGSTRAVKVTARVLSASNKDLGELVKMKRFREDLYYRLAVLPLTLAPLRDRREDIPLLIDRFIELSASRHRRVVTGVSPDGLARLMSHDWPGNVRELQHVVERAVLMGRGPVLTPADLGMEPVHDTPADLPAIARQAADGAERSRILQVLEEVAGNRMQAARRLGISRAGLYIKLKNYGIASAYPSRRSSAR